MNRLVLLLIIAFGLHLNAAPIGLLVPAYFYPPTYWDGLNWAAARVPLAVIVNPGSGPGGALDANYVSAVNNLRAAGGKALGYVYSSYATRDTNAIRADITNFFNFYPLDGIFIDEMQNDAVTNHYNYYAGIYAFIQMKGTNLWVMGNPGTTTQEPYLARPTVDGLMTFENDATNYPAYVPDGWVTNHLARQFCHVIYAVTNAAAMTNMVNLAASRNAGWIFVTDENNNAGNPYDRLPVYWTNEVNYIRSLNLAQPATQLKLLSASNGTADLQFTGAAGVYELQASTNLANWAPAATVNIPTNTLLLKDAAATNYWTRFYRTRQ
jgi:hypothetical protein